MKVKQLLQLYDAHLKDNNNLYQVQGWYKMQDFQFKNIQQFLVWIFKNSHFKERYKSSTVSQATISG